MCRACTVAERFFTVPYGCGVVTAAGSLNDVSCEGQEIELQASSNGHYYGRFMMTPKPDATLFLQARLTAVTLADLAGQSLAATPPPQETGT